MRKILAVAFCALLMTVQSARAQGEASISGTWSGEIVLTGPDGKAAHDTAVLIVKQNGSELSGSIGRTVDQQSPLTGISLHGDQMRFHLDAAGGMDFVLDRKADRLAGTATGTRANATVNLRPAPGLMPHQQLLEEIGAADKALYAAFTTCDVSRYAEYLSKDLEFYRDSIGKTDYEQNLQSLRNRCAEGIQLRRELVPESLIVDGLPGLGAIQAGTQRFYSLQKDGSEHLDATARFTNIWSKDSGSWKLMRVISYDHR